MPLSECFFSIKKKTVGLISHIFCFGCLLLSNLLSAITTQEEHPKPGQQYTGTVREAYLPANPEGCEVLDLLEQAFDQRLVFLGSLHLWPDHQEVEDDEHQNDRQELHEATGWVSSGSGLGVGGTD